MTRTAEPNRAIGFTPLESGIILPTPEAEAAVGHLRALHDPQARYGVPAHITLLYPFARPSSVADAVAGLRLLFGREPTFEFSLAEVRRFPATAYLHPEPSATFVRLTEMLARQWPQFPPYRGMFPTVTPHLTVADHVSTDVMDMFDVSVASRLPIRCCATEAWLICSDEDGFWSRREVFRFGQP
jgi:2'-5' RNA ligase